MSAKVPAEAKVTAPQIIEKKGRVGDEEVINVKRDAFSGALGVFHSAQPTFRTVNPEFGEVSA